MLLCLPILGCGFFEPARTPAPQALRLVLRAKGIEARGFESPQGLVVLAGSQAVKDEVASIHAYLKETRAELVRQGVLTDQGQAYALAQDYTFSSPSTASGVLLLLGRTSNGRLEWKTPEGRTLRSLQDAEAGG